MRDDIKNSVGEVAFGSSLKDLEDGDLDRGYFDAHPSSPLYEDYRPEISEDEREIAIFSDSMDEDNDRNHGLHDEYGFVRRPMFKTDVERN